MSDGGLIGRRAFLAGAVRSGTVAALGLGLDSGPAAAAAHTSAAAGAPAEVRAEPPAPPNVVRYVSRPDLTPIGVSVRSVGGPLKLGGRPAYIFCAPKAAQSPFPRGATPGLMILDGNGELVWFKPLPGTANVPFDFRVQSYRGKPTLTWFQGQSGSGYGVGGSYLLADGGYNQIGRVLSTQYPVDIHEFLLTPQGTALHTAYESSATLRSRGVPVLIGHVQEVDVATNALLFDWASYPAVGLADSYVQPARGVFDYFHVNSIDRWPGAGRQLLISARNTSAVYLLDQATKRIVWQLGGKHGNFRLGDGVRFWYQHDVRALADGSGISVFDDASPPAPEPYASGKVVSLDARKRTAALRHRYAHTDGRARTLNQGNCQLLPDGGHMIGWGAQPFFSVYAPSGKSFGAPLILDGRFPKGAQSYRVYASVWSATPPASELALAVRHAGATADLTAYISWNGATEVARWRLRAGRSESALSPLQVATKHGFETAVRFNPGAARHFQAEALDAHGHVLGRTPIVMAR